MEVYPNNKTKTAEELKVAVIREEFVAFTGDPVAAVILAQFDYW